MNEREPDPSNTDQDEDSPKGPNLIVAYGLIALGLLIAMVVAALIVWPFFKAR